MSYDAFWLVTADLDALRMAIDALLQVWDDIDATNLADDPVGTIAPAVASIEVLRHAFEKNDGTGPPPATYGDLLGMRFDLKKNADARYRALKELEGHIRKRMEQDGLETAKSEYGRAELVKRVDVKIDEFALVGWLKSERPALVVERPHPEVVSVLRAAGADYRGDSLVTEDGEKVDGVDVAESRVFRVMPTPAVERKAPNPPGIADEDKAAARDEIERRGGAG